MILCRQLELFELIGGILTVNSNLSTMELVLLLVRRSLRPVHITFILKTLKIYAQKYFLYPENRKVRLMIQLESIDAPREDEYNFKVQVNHSNTFQLKNN
jgi:hypothetical protein